MQGFEKFQCQDRLTFKKLSIRKSPFELRIIICYSLLDYFASELF